MLRLVSKPVDNYLYYILGTKNSPILFTKWKECLNASYVCFEIACCINKIQY
jgi:hypothetical protein